MSDHPINFFVPGICKTAGSKRAFMLPKMKFPVVVEDCKGSKAWRKVVQQYAAASGLRPMPLWDGPLKVIFEFCMRRPKNQYRTGRNSALLRDDASEYPISRPDLLKLSRAVEDALTGVIWKDDSQIVVELLYKRYSPIPGVYVTVEKITGERKQQ